MSLEIYLDCFYKTCHQAMHLKVTQHEAQSLQPSDQLICVHVVPLISAGFFTQGSLHNNISVTFVFS